MDSVDPQPVQYDDFDWLDQFLDLFADLVETDPAAITDEAHRIGVQASIACILSDLTVMYMSYAVLIVKTKWQVGQPPANPYPEHGARHAAWTFCRTLLCDCLLAWAETAQVWKPLSLASAQIPADLNDRASFYRLLDTLMSENLALAARQVLVPGDRSHPAATVLEEFVGAQRQRLEAAVEAADTPAKNEPARPAARPGGRATVSFDRRLAAATYATLATSLRREPSPKEIWKALPVSERIKGSIHTWRGPAYYGAWKRSPDWPAAA